MRTFGQIVSRVELPNNPHHDYILGIDPGASVGVAYVTPKYIEWGTFHWPSDIRTFDWFIHNRPIRTLIYETFNLFPNKAAVQIGSTFPAPEVIGVIKYLTLTGNAPWTVLEAASPAKASQFSDEVLTYAFNAFGLTENPIRGRHARSAMRAVMVHLEAQGALGGS